MNEEQAKRYSGFKQPVRRTLRGWYGIQRAGTDFVKSFGAWLQILRWKVVPEEPALFVYWQVEDQGSIVRRAIHHKDRIQEAFAKNKNPLTDTPVESATAEEVVAVHDWCHDKATAGTSAKCAMMSTYVDDCSMDGKKDMSNFNGSVALKSKRGSDVPELVQRIVGVTRAEAVRADG